jgi:hypothetical protein
LVARSFMRNVVGPTVEVNYFRKIYNCMLDDQVAAQNSDNVRRNPTCFSELRGRLDTCRFKLPPLYHENVHKSCIDNLDKLGENGFNQILLRPQDVKLVL